MASLFVTGGSGFLGSILLRELLGRGHRVTNIDLVQSEIQHPALRSIVGDIRNDSLLSEALRSDAHEVVFHCAAHLAHGSMQPDELWSSNVNGTKTLAQQVQAAGVRHVVFISSNCLWGRGFSHPVAEDQTPEPIEVYGRSKWEGEKILQSHSGDFSTTIIRCPTIIDEGRLGLLSILFEFIVENRKVWVVGDGGNRYQFIYAADLVDAMLLAWSARRHQLFGIGSDNVPTIRECYEYVIAQAGSSSRVASLPKGPTLLGMRAAYRLGVSPLGPYHYRMIASDFAFDTRRIKSELGWAPTLTNNEMLSKSFSYYAANRFEIHARRDASAHRMPSNMGAIRILKWLS